MMHILDSKSTNLAFSVHASRTNSSQPQLRQHTSTDIAMSSLKSALSSVVSISSLSEGSGTHKRKESFRGEIFVSSNDGGSSIGGSSSFSSDGVKSNLQEAGLPGLLGNPESTTASGSTSDGFPSLAVSGSSLSSNQSAPVLALTVSRASEALRELTNGIQVIGRQGDANGDTEKQKLNEPLQQIFVLENVEYVASLPHATSCTDLSTMDEPITKEMAGCIFSRRIVPSEIPMTADNPSDISTLYGGKHIAGEHELDDELDEDEPGVDVEKGNTEVQATTITEVQVSFPWHRRVLGQRSRTELFFMIVIGLSTSILVVLLVIVLR